MKKYIAFLCAGILIGVSCAACEGNTKDSDLDVPYAVHPLDEENGGQNVGAEIKPVPVGKELSEVLWKNLIEILMSIGYYEGEEDCMMVDSMDEFPKVDFDGNPIQFPHIDFENHTLVVGFYPAWNGGVYIADQNIVIGADEITMTQTLKNSDGFYNQAAIPKPFWSLYPKLPRKPINVVYAGEDLPWARD